MSTKQRFRKERFDAVLASARECPGARVKVNLVTGEAVIDFPAITETVAPATADEEALRAEEAMIAAMGGKR